MTTTPTPAAPPSTAPDLLLLCPLHDATRTRLEARFTVHCLWEAADPGALLERLAPACRAVATTGAVGVQRDTLQKLPAVRLVASFGVGYDAVDLAYCRERGITVTNTPDVLTDDVADLALLLTLTLLRRAVVADRFVRAGRWLREGFPLAHALRPRHVGIVGMGRIGQAIAQRFESFGCRISWYGPHPKDVRWSHVPDLVELARQVDVLVVACPGGEATRGLVSREVLTALGAKGSLINIARGSVVDEPALVELLLAGGLGGAGLDVFAAEPSVPEALWDLDQVVLLPHIGSGTHETRHAMGSLMADNVEAFFDGRPLPTPVPL